MHIISTTLPGALLGTVRTKVGEMNVPLAPGAIPKFGGLLSVDTFGGKALLEVDGPAQFAEAAILRLFQAEGWQGRWLETYGLGKLRPGY